jgi:parallel beta-helix repeat protein
MRYMALCLSLLCLATGTLAATLDVGTARSFVRIEDALLKASPGDVINVYPGEYKKTALLVKTPNLHLKVAAEKITLDGSGYNYSGKGAIPRAIIQFEPSASDCTLEGFILLNASNESFNGAGIRINQANNITVRNCIIQKNEMGIMSNGSVKGNTATNQIIEGCLISDNGTQKQAGYNHNLYLGGTSVTVRNCEVARSVTGHNIKSRAHVTRVEQCNVHDSANREFDLVDGEGNTDVLNSDAYLVENRIVKSDNCTGNRNVIHFGKDGKSKHSGTLYLVRNRIQSPYATAIVDVSDGIGVHFHSNTIGGAKLLLYNLHAPGAKAFGSGNMLPENVNPALLPCLEQHGVLKKAD